MGVRSLWDLAGKILGSPVHRLPGGYRDEIPAYADGGMFERGVAGHAAWAARSVAAGFRAVKYHVMGEGPDQIVETVRQIRAAVGPDVRVMVDVHKPWDPWRAVATARRLHDYDVTWLEEPVNWDDQVWGTAILAANTSIPVAAGESEYTSFAPCSGKGSPAPSTTGTACSTTRSGWSDPSRAEPPAGRVSL